MGFAKIALGMSWPNIFKRVATAPRYWDQVIDVKSQFPVFSDTRTTAYFHVDRQFADAAI
jgi:hypothetical protein